MAKEEKENQNPENQEIQEPEPPKPKRKKGLSLPLIIGISLAALLILIGGTLGAVYLMVNNMMQNNNTEQTTEKTHDENHEEDEAPEQELDLEENYNYLKNVAKNQHKNVRYMELGEIITNPKNSDKFVVIDIGVEFVAYGEDGKVLVVHSEGEGDDHSGESVGGGNEAHKFFKHNDLARIKSVVNNVIWSNTVQELQNKRSEIPDMLMEDFEKIFKKEGLVIKNIIVLRFIIQ